MNYNSVVLQTGQRTRHDMNGNTLSCNGSGQDAEVIAWHQYTETRKWQIPVTNKP